MRTTLDIDDDVLAAAKEMARAEGKTMGAIISELMRKALTTPSGGGFAEAQAMFDVGDWPTFPNREGLVVTTELVKSIQEELDMEDAVAFDHTTGKPRTDI